MADNFLLFLYTIDEHGKEGLYVFFEEDLRHWKISGGEYSLSVSEKQLAAHQDKLFTAATAEKIWQRLGQVDIKKYTTLIIDRIFLYRQEYPGKKLRTLTLAAVICEILIYNRFPENKAEIYCVLFDSTDFSLGQVLTMPHSKVSATSLKGYGYRLPLP